MQRKMRALVCDANHCESLHQPSARFSSSASRARCTCAWVALEMVVIQRAAHKGANTIHLIK